MVKRVSKKDGWSRGIIDIYIGFPGLVFVGSWGVVFKGIPQWVRTDLGGVLMLERTGEIFPDVVVEVMEEK